MNETKTKRYNLTSNLPGSHSSAKQYTKVIKNHIRYIYGVLYHQQETAGKMFQL